MRRLSEECGREHNSDLFDLLACNCQTLFNGLIIECDHALLLLYFLNIIFNSTEDSNLIPRLK